jgi:hypothetical protein
MASMETTTTLNGLYKEVYADKIKDLIPESDVLLKMDNFVSKDQREGNLYHQPVLLALPTGATWGLGAVTLNTAIASTMGDAQVAGSAITHRDLLSYDAAAKAAKGGKQSFAEATSLVVKNLVKATSKFLELDLLYGGATGIGVSVTDSSANINTTSTTLTIRLSSWAPSIFAGMENAQVVFYREGTTTLVSSGADSVFTIVSQNVVPASSTVGGTLVVSGTTTGISALDTAAASYKLAIYWNSSYGNQMSGLKKILTNTGNLFNVSASTYSLWGANTYDCGSTQLTFGKLQSALAMAVNRGFDSDAVVLVSPLTFANLVDEQAGARRYDSSYSSDKEKNGTKKLEFYGPSGVMEIKPHIFMHAGIAMILPKDEVIRMGPVDGVTSTLPGMPGEFFVQSQTYAAYELRNYANEAIFIEAPAHAVYITSIVNA